MLLKVSGIMVNDKQNEHGKEDSTLEQTGGRQKICGRIDGGEEHGWRSRPPASAWRADQAFEYRIPFE
jgi:hypothetical protein